MSVLGGGAGVGLSLCVLYLKVLTWPWSYCRRMLGEVGGRGGRGEVQCQILISTAGTGESRAGLVLRSTISQRANGENVKVF